MPAARPLEFIHEFMYVFILEKEKKNCPIHHSAFSTSHVDWNSDKIGLYHLAKVLFNVY